MIRPIGILFVFFVFAFATAAQAKEPACDLANVQRLESRLPLSIALVYDARSGAGFLVEGRRVVTSWSLLLMRRGPEVVLADGSRYRSHVADVQGDLALLALDELLEAPSRPEVKPVPLPIGGDFLRRPPHLLAYLEGGALHLEYQELGKDIERNPYDGSERPDEGLPILTCDGAVIGMTEWSLGAEQGPTRRERATLVSMMAGRPKPERPGETRWGVGYDALTGLVDERGIGGFGISMGPKWTYADRLQLDLRGDAFLLFNAYHIGGRFQGGLAAGPRLRLTEGLYLVPQLGGQVSVTTTALVDRNGQSPCSESSSCMEIHERLKAIEGKPSLVPFGRLTMETGLADGIIGGTVFYSLHWDPQDHNRTHEFGFGLHF